MRIDSSHLINVTQARQQFASLLDGVLRGETFHLMRDTEVIAHVVPANTLIANGSNVEATLVMAVVHSTAKRFAEEVMRRGYDQVGDDIGRVLAWLWECDPTKAVEYLCYYSAILIDELQQNRYSRPAFHQLWYSIKIGLGAGLTRPQINDFEAFARQHISDYCHIFTAYELGGKQRPRECDDPWPDTPAYGGRGYAKRRWCHLETGQFIPNPDDNSHALPSVDDDWWRIKTINGTRAVLCRPNVEDVTPAEPVIETQSIDVTVDDPALWVPTLTSEPYRWGYPESLRFRNSSRRAATALST